MVRSTVLAEQLPDCIDDFASCGGRVNPLLLKICFDKCAIVAVRNKTNLLAVVLLGHRQTELSRKLPNLRFHHPPERKQCPRQLGLCQSKKKVGLIFVSIEARTHLISATTLIRAQTSI